MPALLEPVAGPSFYSQPVERIRETEYPLLDGTSIPPPFAFNQSSRVSSPARSKQEANFQRT